MQRSNGAIDRLAQGVKIVFVGRGNEYALAAEFFDPAVLDVFNSADMPLFVGLSDPRIHFVENDQSGLFVGFEFGQNLVHGGHVVLVGIV